MARNIGTLDQAIRLYIALMIAYACYMHLLTGTAGIVLGSWATGMAAITLTGYSPFYHWLGINTCHQV
ncbi:hypothetical protein DCC81_10070 [Chitinophaga parva]|uniref:Inner membrane protein YgaP-like transmembrane domain-containing protein n=1 Tax=Chitinophaga parva TaxID=2169414 RepID=A0A2T7BQ53_9BACT|nr:DUF2892 domain-containing protein [Chitinophaga parva]PUZ29761.1 hypothetical protein DCC81_10070 [Chitinophaga parva]